MTTPEASPSWRAHMPAQLTTYSQPIVPWLVVTPVTAPPRVVTPSGGDALEDRRAGLARALGQRHRDVDRVHAAVVLDVEARQQIVGARQREQLADLARRELVHVDAAGSG
jgi:hypothetical protein